MRLRRRGVALGDNEFNTATIRALPRRLAAFVGLLAIRPEHYNDASDVARHQSHRGAATLRALSRGLADRGSIAHASSPALASWVLRSRGRANPRLTVSV